MTLFVTNISYYLIVTVLLITLVGIFGFTINKIYKKQRTEVKKKLETLLPIAFVALLIALYYFSQSLFSSLQEKDVVITENEVYDAKAGDRFISTEEIIIIPFIYREFGYVRDITIDDGQIIRMRMVMTNPEKMSKEFQHMREIGAFSEGDYSFSFETYFEKIIQPKLHELLENETDLREIESQLTLSVNSFSFELLYLNHSEN